MERGPGQHASGKQQHANRNDADVLAKLFGEAAEYQLGNGGEVQQIRNHERTEGSDRDRPQPARGGSRSASRFLLSRALPWTRFCRRSWRPLATLRRGCGGWHTPILPLPSHRRKP
jgi:hypothetical protein